MKLNSDLIRDILLKVESDPIPKYFRDSYEISGYSADVIQYHLLLLEEAGFLICYTERGDDQVIRFPFRLTWDGHQFVETTRNPDIWAKLKKSLVSVFGFSHPLIMEVAKEYIKEYLFKG